MLRLEHFCKSYRELASWYSVFHQVKLFRRGHMIDQGLNRINFCPLAC